jgi:hypothetical protein
MGHFIGGQLVGLVVGFLVGVFTPGLTRIVKSWFSGEVKAVKAKL